jgi:hypothetical protein
METAKAKAQRLRKATQASARARAKATKGRDEDIFLAYLWLTKSPLTTQQTVRALGYLTGLGRGVNAPVDGTGEYLFLARATGLTKQRIWAIVRAKMDAQLTHKS